MGDRGRGREGWEWVEGWRARCPRQGGGKGWRLGSPDGREKKKVVGGGGQEKRTSIFTCSARPFSM